MESKSSARTRDMVPKRKCEQSDLSTSVQHTPKKRSSLHRLLQSISNSVRVTKKNRNFRKKPTASTCVLLSAGGDVSRLDKSSSHTDSRMDASLLNDTSIYMQTALAINDTAISRHVAPIASLGQRPVPEGASYARCDHYTKGRSRKRASMLGRSFTAAQSYEKRASNTSLDLYTHTPYASSCGLAKLNGSLFVRGQAVKNRLQDYRHQTFNCTYTQGSVSFTVYLFLYYSLAQ